METKRVVISSALALALFAGWFFFITWANKKFGPPVDATAQNTTNTTASPAAPAGTQPTTTTTAPTTVAVGGAASQPASTGLQLLAGGASKPVELGSAAHEDERFAMLLRTTPAGAGVDSVVLNRFYRSVDDPKKEPYTFQNETDESILSQYGHSLATRSVTIDGQTIDVSKADWTLESQDATSATYTVTLGTGGKPAIKVLKTFHISQRSEPSLGYEVRVV
jgi:hypothetical protein